MALNSLEVTVPAADVQFIGGGAGRPVTDFNTSEPLLRGGRQIKRFPALTAIYKGQPMDGLVCESTTELDNLGEGGVLAAQSDVTITIRADAKPGFNGGAPRGQIVGKTFCEGFSPVASLAELVASASRRGGKPD